MTPVWYGILGLAILASWNAHASDDVQLTVTIRCDIHADHLDGIMSGIDEDMGVVDFGPYTQDCTILTRHTGMAEQSSVTVTIPDGALFPDCQVTNDCFDPYTVTIPEGITVSWVNDDTVPHTVTAIQPHPDGVLNSMVPPGEQFAYTFETPGTYWYACSVHPWAKGVIVVESDGIIGTTPVMPAIPLRDSMALQRVAEMLTQYREDGVESFQHMTELQPFRDVAGMVVSLANQTIISHNTNPLYVGYHYGHMMESASIPVDVILRVAPTQGVWISYPVPNDMGEITSHERAWVRIYDDYAFISSYAVTMRENVQGIVSEMTRLYALGEITFDMIDSFDMSSQTYPFVMDSDGLLVADGSGGMVHMSGVIHLIPLEEGQGMWIEHMVHDPETGVESLKRSWLVMHDGYLFGAGYHP